METVLVKIVDASPYLGFVLLFIWFEYIREQKRIAGAEALETRREAHEKAMQEKQLQHDRDINTLWSAYIQEMVNEIKNSHTDILRMLEEHEFESEKRYERMGITKDLINRAIRK